MGMYFLIHSLRSINDENGRTLPRHLRFLGLGLSWCREISWLWQMYTTQICSMCAYPFPSFHKPSILYFYPVSSLDKTQKYLQILRRQCFLQQTFDHLSGTQLKSSSTIILTNVPSIPQMLFP